MKYSTFSPEISYLPGGCHSWVEDVQLGTDLWAFSSPSILPTLAQPLWLPLHRCCRSTASCLEFGFKEGSCKTQMAWPHVSTSLWKHALMYQPDTSLLAFWQCLHLVPAHTHGAQGSNLSFNPLLHEALGDTNLAGICWVPWAPECPSLPSCQHPYSNLQLVQTSVLLF